MNAVEVKDIRFGYRDKLLFSSLSFSLKEGSFLVVLGPNGVGKTSLLKIILGLNKVLDGDVNIFSKNISSYSREDMAKIVSYVPQSIDFSYPVSTFFFLRTALLRFRKDEDKKERIIKEYLRLWDIESLSDKLLNKISGGERQIVLLLRAFLQDAPIIVADEPFSHLDIKNRIKYMQYLMIFAITFSKTIIVALHDINIAYNFFDYALILFNDKEYIFGKVADVMNVSNLRKAFLTQIDEIFISERKFFLCDI